jgi:transcriptional regulator with XRE-family HTH domain
MAIRINEVHIGQAIAQRIKELDITKTEFARRIGINQQHVNNLLERQSITTARLIVISKALDFNFFSLYCDINNISATNSTLALSLGNGHALSVVSELKSVELMSKFISALESQLEDKQEIINMKDEMIKELKKQK